MWNINVFRIWLDVWASFACIRSYHFYNTKEHCSSIIWSTKSVCTCHWWSGSSWSIGLASCNWGAADWLLIASLFHIVMLHNFLWVSAPNFLHSCQPTGFHGVVPHMNKTPHDTIYSDRKGFPSAAEPWNFAAFLSVSTLLGLDMKSWIAIMDQSRFLRSGFRVNHFRIKVLRYPLCVLNLRSATWEMRRGSHTEPQRVRVLQQKKIFFVQLPEHSSTRVLNIILMVK